MSDLVLTIGHSTRTFEQFADLLSMGEVRHLVDVRRFPGSRRHPQFGKDVLAGELRRACRIGYSHLSELGGRRDPRKDSPNGGWRNPSFRGYADHMATPEFEEGLLRLIELCEAEGRVCLMCSEAVWWRCHRRMIADALVVRGYSVEHILDESRRQTHTLTPWAEVVDGANLIYPADQGASRMAED